MSATIKAQLCHVAASVREVPRHWIMEPKLDGWRWQVHRDRDGVHGYAGRNGTEYPVPAEMAEALEHLPLGTVLDGELLVAGGVSTDVPTRLARGTVDGLMFVAFDALRVMGYEVMGKPWIERRELLEAALDHVPSEYAHLVMVSVVTDVDAETFDHWMTLGFEGAVVKDPDASYHPGRRSRAWCKVKPSQTMDAIVLGWHHGAKASNRDRCGSLHIHLLDTGAETTCKYDASPQEAEAMLGRRIEIQHFGQQPSGKVRHPTFVRTREDLEGVAA